MRIVRGQVVVAGGIALLLASCARKVEEAPAPPPAPVVEERAFSSPTWAARYQERIAEYKTLFAPPSTGAVFRVKLKNGRSLTGQLAGIFETNILMIYQNASLAIPRSDLVEASRALFYEDDFARLYADQDIDAAMAAHPDGPVPGLLSMIAHTGVVLEIRYAVDENIDVRRGPGRAFKRAEDVAVLRGEKLYVIGERDGWICFKRQPAEERATLWTHKFASIPSDDDDAAQRDAEIALLQASGVLTQINPQLNVAQVDAGRWNELDPAARRGMSRTLAFYCADKKGTKTYWVDIRDAESGKRLARYSENMGFKMF